MKVQEIRELIKLVDQSTLEEFEYEIDGAKIKMKKNNPEKQTAVAVIQQPLVQQEKSFAPQVVTSVQPSAPELNVQAEQATDKKASQADQDQLHKITSPMVGTFYQSPSPDMGPYVKPGSKVSKNSVVCIVEAMKLFNEIEAEVDGEIVEILVKDGQLVEYGQPLFLVKPE